MTMVNGYAMVAYVNSISGNQAIIGPTAPLN